MRKGPRYIRNYAKNPSESGGLSTKKGKEIRAVDKRTVGFVCQAKSLDLTMEAPNSQTDKHLPSGWLELIKRHKRIGLISLEHTFYI